MVLGDFNSKLGRCVENLTGKWSVHKHSNKAGKDILELMRQSKLTAVSTHFQPNRRKTNATYLAKDPQYKPSQIDYILTSQRWATAVKDCKVRWGISVQRWGRHYDHAAVMCTMTFKIRSPIKQKSRPCDYRALKNSAEIQNNYEQHVYKNINQNKFDKECPSESLNNLQKALANAGSTCLPPRKTTPLRKREVSTATKQLMEERKNTFSKMTPAEQKQSTKDISKSSRNDFRNHINNIIDDLATAEASGNTREVTRLIKTLSGKASQPSPMPSKDLSGDPIVSSEQLLAEWNTFLGPNSLPHRSTSTHRWKQR